MKLMRVKELAKEEQKKVVNHSFQQIQRRQRLIVGLLSISSTFCLFYFFHLFFASIRRCCIVFVCSVSPSMGSVGGAQMHFTVEHYGSHSKNST